MRALRDATVLMGAFLLLVTFKVSPLQSGPDGTVELAGFLYDGTATPVVSSDLPVADTPPTLDRSAPSPPCDRTAMRAVRVGPARAAEPAAPAPPPSGLAILAERVERLVAFEATEEGTVVRIDVDAAVDEIRRLCEVGDGWLVRTEAAGPVRRIHC